MCTLEIDGLPSIQCMMHDMEITICSQMPEGEIKNGLAARKMQKADREKLRRDRLNEHFLELGNVLGTVNSY